MSFDLCQIPMAQKPYYIENISTNIYSIEELCFYLHENPYLIDETLMNEVLCDWIRDELQLKKLYQQMYSHLEKQDGIAAFILPIFREAGYLDAAGLREYQEKLARLEVQPGDMRQKMKGDYLIRCGMYTSAITEYYHVLKRQGPGNLGVRFYADIWNNLGCAYARLFLFSDAADCFYKAWDMVKTREMLRKYVSVLPLFLSEERYREKLEELGADTFLIGKIQEYNVHVIEETEEALGREKTSEGGAGLRLEAIREEYRKGAAQ